MEAVKTNISDDVSTTSSQAEQSIEILNINNKNVDDSVNIEDSDVSQVSNDKEPVVLNTICKSLDASKTSSDSEHLVQNLLFDIKSDEFMSTNLVDETSLNFNIKSYNSDDKNIDSCLPLSTNIFNPFNESQVLSSSDEATYSLINNTTNKKRSFSIDEISKDETSQNSQSMSTYSNDYTCFLSEQTDAINNLTPFKRSNSYYFDSPMKKLCPNKPSSEEINSQMPNGTFNEINNKTFNGFTSIQSLDHLEVDCIKDRYDGSDSGFGSELAEDKNIASLSEAALNSYKNDFILNQESSFEDLQRTSNEFLSAMEVLKPKFSDSILDATSSIEVSNNYGIIKSILKRNQPIDYGSILASDKVNTVKKRKNINFANVTVFYFPRVQGFTCVPSQVITSIYNFFFNINNLFILLLCC